MSSILTEYARISKMKTDYARAMRDELKSEIYKFLDIPYIWDQDGCRPDYEAWEDDPDTQQEKIKKGERIASRIGRMIIKMVMIKKIPLEIRYIPEEKKLIVRENNPGQKRIMEWS